MNLRFLVAILIAVVYELGAQHIEISGRILDARGNPLSIAHVEFRRAGRIEPLVRLQANPDGSFALRTQGMGLFMLRIMGIHSFPLEFPLIVAEKGFKERVEVQLATLPIPAVRDSVLAAPETALPTTTDGALLRQDKRVYSLVSKPGSRYRFVIRGSTQGVVTVSSRDSIIPGFDGYYIGIQRDSMLVFDPAELPQRNDRAVVRCHTSAWQEFVDAYLAWKQYWRAYVDSSNVMNQRAALGIAFFDLSQLYAAVGVERWRDTVMARLRLVNSPEAEQMWLLFGAQLPPQGQEDPLLLRALQRISPSSPLWGLEPQLVYQALATRPEHIRRQYLDELIEMNPDTGARATVAFTELVSAFTSGDRERAQRLYRVLTTQCAAHPLAMTARRYNPDRIIQVGNRLPQFRLSPKGKASTTITPATFVGKPLLIAFITPSCIACQKRIEELGKWLSASPGRLHVLVISAGSLSGDPLLEKLQPIPHTLVELATLTDQQVEQFEVEIIPTFILSDAKGVIVATTEQLTDFQRDVERFLSSH